MKKSLLVVFLPFILLTIACQCFGPAFLTQMLASITEAIATTETPTAASPFPVTASTHIGESREYDIIQTIVLTNDGPGVANRVNVWVAQIQTIQPYQTLTDFSISPESSSTLVDEYGNQYAEIEILDIPAGESRTVELTYQVSVQKITNSILECLGDEPDVFLEAEDYIETEASEISKLAGELKQGTSDCETARAIYDYLGDHFSYSGFVPEDTGALQALNKGSGDCTEFADLFVALNRAAGIPASFVEGVTCCTTNGYSAGDIKHDWAEVYLPGNGWVPADPTWGRFPNQRELYFASMTPDHIIVTRGRNLETLGGYHYYYYRYWWDGATTQVSSTETWSILPVQRDD